MGWATGYSGRWESRFDFQSVGLSFSCPALVTDKAKRVEPVPGSKGIKKAPALSPEASSRMLKSREASPDAPTLSQSTDHTRATKSLSKKCRSLSKKCKSSHPPAFRIIGTGLVFCLIVFAATSTRAQVTIDASKITCDQFVHSKVSSPRLIAAWLSGYYSGKRDNRVIDLQTLEANLSKLENFCYQEKNFKLPVMQAVEQLLGGDK